MKHHRLFSTLSLSLLLGCTGTISEAPGGGTEGGGATGAGAASGSGTGGSGATPGSGATGAGAGTASGGDGGTGAVSSVAGTALNGEPIFSRFVRLTHHQWENSVRDLLRLGSTPGLSSGFTGDPPEGHFSNNERALYVTSGLWSDYQRAAETLSEQVARNGAALAALTGGSTDAMAFIRDLGRRAYRRPLTTAEEQRYQALFATGAEVFQSGDTFADGAQLVIEAILQSPHFVYRTELGTDGAPLSGFELASKLSFLLRDTIPDNALLDAAAAGQLDTPEGLLAHAESMLNDPQGEAVLVRFHSELLGYDRYRAIDKNRALFPAYNEGLPDKLREADNQFTLAMIRGGFGLRDFYTSTIGFVDAETAALYGASAAGDELTQVDLGPSRPGIFTRLGFLAYNATLRDPDPIHRGVDLNHRVLCAPLAPPPGIIPALPELVPGQTNRERVTAHTGPGTCGATCHGDIINPVGFAFENFDALGQERTTDNGKPVDTTGAYAFADGLKEFANANELLDLIAESPQAHACYAAHLAEFSLARDMARADADFVGRLDQISRLSNGSIKSLVLGIIGDPAFRIRAGG